MSSMALPAGWEMAPLGDLLTGIETGKSFKCEERPPQADEVGVVKVSAVTWGRYQENQSKTCLDAGRVNADFFIKSGDFLFSRANTIDLVGACVIAKEVKLRVMLSDKILRFGFAREKMKPWVLHFLRSQQGRAQIEELASGNQESMRNIGQERVAQIRLPLPPVEEQARIIAKLEELFSSLDSAEDELKSAQKKLTLYRQSLLKAAVEGDLTAGWRRQRAGLATGDDLLSRILARRRDAWETVQLERFEAEGRKPPKDWQKKYAEPVRPDGGGLPDVPPEWAWAKVNQTGLVQLGRQRAPQFHTGPNMLPYLRVANVFENRIDVSDVMQMHFSDADEDAYKLAAGDILLNEGQSLELVGRPAIYRGELPKACFTNTLVRYSVEEGVLPEFALAVFLHYMHSGRFRRIATITTNIAHLGAGRFAELEFPLPGTEEQEEIVRRLAEQMESVERQRAAISKALKQAAAQRQNILRAAFSGQLVAQDPGDEPAGVLLERIRAERAAGQPARTRGRKPRVVKDAA